jgi:two-component system, cell cycle response regulator CtrA
MRVLLIKGLAAVGEHWLRAADLVVEAAETGEDALDLARHYDFDIVLLDLTPPDMDGYEVLRRMRNAAIQVPVLAVSSAPQPQAKTRALQAGADDCVTAPFHKDELLARMHAIIRRSRGHSQAKLRVGRLQLNLDTQLVTVNGQEVHLTGKEFAILELLVLRKGMILTKDTFLNHLYGGMDEPEAKIIDVFICKLRRKLADAGGEGLIGTVWGRGYIIREPSAVEPVQESTWLPSLTDRLVA